jgi:hypothetical protein
MLKKDQRRKKYGLLPPKIAESDIVSLGHSLCVCGGSIYNKDTSQNTLSNHLPSLTMIHPATGWFEIVVATNKSATSIQDLCHNTWLAPYPRPQFIVFINWGEFKLEFKQMILQDNYGIKAKPITSHNQHNKSKCIHLTSTQSCQ